MLRSVGLLLLVLGALGVAHAVDAVGTGLEGSYFAGQNFEDLKIARLDALIDFSSTGKPVDKAVGAENFSVRWRGSILPAFSETYTLSVTTDDGVRLYVDGKLLVDMWVGRGPTEDTAKVALTAGVKATVIMEYNQGGGPYSAQFAWSSPSQPKQLVPTSCLFPPDPPKNAALLPVGVGLKGEYFDGAAFEERRWTRIDPSIDFAWGGEPHPTVQPDNFSVRWTGLVLPYYTEEYTFYVASDDGVRLWVNEALLIDNWGGPTPKELAAALPLVGGQMYDIRVEFCDTGGGASIYLRWSSPNTPRQTIRPEHCFPTDYFAGTIYYQDSAELRRCTAYRLRMGADPEKVTAGAEGELAAAADGKTLVIASGAKAVWKPLSIPDTDIVVMADGVARALPRKGTMETAPAISADGTTIAYASSDGGTSELYLIHADGTGLKRLTNNKLEDTSPACSPDGATVVFQSKRAGQWDLYRVNADGTGETRLTTQGGAMPAFTPDGTRIAFISTRDGNAELYTMQADGTDQRRLTTTDAAESHPGFSPTGTQLVVAAEAAGRANLFILNADGTGLRKLTDTGKAYWPVWTK